MTRTPMNSRVLSDDGRKTPLGNRILKDRTPPVDVDQALLDTLRSLNLAVAVVAMARERGYTHPGTRLSPRVATDALLHLKDAANLLDKLRKSAD